MQKLTFLAVLMPAIVLAACSDQASDKGITAMPQATPEIQGQHVAQNLCSNCHGAAYTGANLGSIVTPSLAIAASYTHDQFSTLLLTGVARDGRVVHPAMSATRSLSAADRTAVQQYLVALLP